jgi:hypothetical protein
MLFWVHDSMEARSIYIPNQIFAMWYILWQYQLWSFKCGDTKLERFMPKNQRTETIEF